jgi:hypothetical protein
MVPCQMDGCRCGLPHPAYADCNVCRGRGHYVGGDEYHPCMACRDRFKRDYPRPEQVAAEDAIDAAAKERRP